MGALSKEDRENETLATALRVLALSTDQLASLLWSEGCPWCLSAHISFRTRLPIASEVTSSVIKHCFPKCSELYSHNVTLSHEWVNKPAVSQHRSGPGDDFLSLIGLFYRASQRPWQLQRWLSLACFHYKPWHLISLREMASERWGTRVAKPFFSALDDTLC